MAVLLFTIVSQARPTNLSADRFEYTHPVRYTEIDPRCGWLGQTVYNGDYAVTFKS